MKTKTILVVLGLVLACAPRLRAQDLAFEISPYYGYRFGGAVQNSLNGKTYSFQDSPAYGLFLDVGPTNSDLKLEVMWSRQDTHLDLQGLGGAGRVNLSIDQIQIGASSETGGEHLRGYLSGMLGGTYFSPEGFDTDLRFSLGVGGGAKYYFTRNIALRADLRGFCTFVDTSSAFISHNGTTVVGFSGSTMWQGQATLGLSIVF
jgi:hypothetical protein